MTSNTIRRSRGILLLFLLVAGFLLSACREEASRSDAQSESPSVQKGAALDSAKGAAAAASLTAQDFLNASLEGRMDRVRQALAQGMDVNVTNEAGFTPLMLAAYNGHRAVARFLLEQGASVSDRGPKGRTPLIFAASGPFPETVELLLEWEADPNATDRAEGWSPLMFAAAEGHREVVQILLDHGADVALKDREGETALTFARNNNRAGVVKVLEEAQP